MPHKSLSHKTTPTKLDVNPFNNYYIFYMSNKDLKGKMHVRLPIIPEEDSDRSDNTTRSVCFLNHH